MASSAVTPPIIDIDFGDELFPLFFSNQIAESQYVDYTEADLNDITAGFARAGFSRQATDKLTSYIGSVSDLLDLTKSGLTREASDVLLCVQYRIEDDETDVVRVYAPAIFKSGPDAVLKIGNNFVHIEQEGDQFRIGGLPVKRLEFETEKTLEDVVYTTCYFILQAGSYRFKIKALLNKQMNLTRDDVEDGIAAGEPIQTFLSALSSRKMLRNLSIGSYPIGGISEVPDNSTQYKYDRFLLHLEDGTTVWGLNSPLKRDLNTFFNLHLGNLDDFSEMMKHQALCVTSKEESGGKTYVKAKFVPRTHPSLQDSDSPVAAMPSKTDGVTQAPVVKGSEEDLPF